MLDPGGEVVRPSGMRMSRIGVVLAVGLVLSGASGCSGSSTPSGTPTAVPTSDWTGGAGAAALLAGTLVKDSAGCLVVGQTVVVWPKGYTAVTTDGGVVEVLNTRGEPVARTGAPISVGGGAPAQGLTGPCLTDRQVFEVNDDPKPIG